MVVAFKNHCEEKLLMDADSEDFGHSNSKGAFQKVRMLRRIYCGSGSVLGLFDCAVRVYRACGAKLNI